jgi:subtilisin family serine protease
MRQIHFARRAALLVAFMTGAIFAVPALGAPASAATRATESGPGGVAPLTSTQAAALSTNVTDRVIVVLKNQLTAIPDSPTHAAARTDAVSAAQAPFLTELKQTNATHVTPYSLINAFSATMSPGEAQRLSQNPDVASVVPDEPIPVADSTPSIPSARGPGGGSGALTNACAKGGQVQLNPQAVLSIHAASNPGCPPSAQALGYTGAGVKVGFIADGLDINNPDFVRANGQPVFVDYQDFSGTGTSAPTDGAEAFEDASSIAAQGREVYNLQDFNPSLPKACNIRILGVAPGASLVGLNVFGSSNEAFNSVFLAAINYAVNVDHVNVLNESFGSNPFPDEGSLDLTRMADDAATAAGVTVTVSTGDAGVTNTIGSPATDPDVISAGASTTYRAYAQSGIGGITYPTVTGWLNNNISALSSAGFDQSGGTVDVVAPGDLNWALCTPNPTLYEACTNEVGQGASVELAGGTSESAPLTAGTAALVIQAYEQNHGGAAPTPAVVKQIIVSTANDISAPAEQQGAGLLDAYSAVQAAASYPGTTQVSGHALLDSATQFNAVAPVSTPQTFNETITNTGGTAQTVALSTRALSSYTSLGSTTVQLADATNNFAVVQFNVPAGQARLDGSIAYVAAGPSTDFTAGDSLTLISPSGQEALYSLPQGAGNFGDAQVANPAPGKWTALILGFPSSEGGTVGPVQFTARTATWVPFGSLSTSSVNLPAGGSKTFALSVDTPAAPGDTAGSIVMTSQRAGGPAFAATTTVPVTLRSVIPTPNPSTTVTTTLTGGNGRQYNSGQTVYYQVNVPTGLAELNASISTPNAANTFWSELIDPATGEAASTAASGIPAIGATGSGITAEAGAQLHVLNPDAGTWTVAVNFYNQVSGTALSQPITITLNDVPVTVKAPKLPDSAATTLPAGQPTTVMVKVTNTGSSPEAYFVDARLDQTTQLNLPALTSSQVTVPIESTTLPLYLVPTHTTSITASAHASAPIYFDYWWAFGDPDLISSGAPLSGSPSGTFNSSPVVAGFWGITPFQNGPDGANGVTPVTTQTALSATTAAFDPAVTSPTGDLWLQAENASALVSPSVVAPGQTVKIPVTITPSGNAGTKVTGMLYVDDLTSVVGAATNNSLALNVNQASDLAAIPYTYTIGGTSSSSSTRPKKGSK